MRKIGNFPQYHLSFPGTLALAVLLSGGITLLSLWCQPNAFRAVISIFLRKPLLIVLNALPVGLLVLTFSCLLRNVFFGAAATNLIIGVLSVANRVKIEVRDEPVFPRDLGLLKEVGSAVGTYDIQFPWVVIAVVFTATLLLAAAGLFIGSKSFSSLYLRGWRGSLLGAAASLAALVLATLTLLGSSSLYEKIGASNPYRLSVVFNETGFPYSFFHNFTTYLVDKPEGYSRSEAEGWDSADTASGQGKAVNVIMVMNEAFSDITDFSAFTYSKEADPLTNLHALQNDPHTISGHMVTPTFAGGTANTEFDVLTGIQTNALSASTTSSFRVVNRNLDTLFRVFSEDGYHTSYFHPGDDWFYNRENVLRWFGAEETVFVDEMSDLEYKGSSYWVADHDVASRIENAFSAAMAEGTPLFHFSTTIQNHMAYTAAKYGERYVFPEVENSAELSDDVRTMLEVYIEGVRDADAMLGRLWTYFQNRTEPVVLVFFGDHLPYLGDNQLAYAQLGMTETEYWEDLASYQTPYIIWANEAAAQTLDWNNAVASLDLPQDHVLSAAFLGSTLLELTGRTGASSWFDYLNQLRRVTPVVHKQIAVLADGTYLPEGVDNREDLSALVEKWRKWSYYKLRQKEISS